MRMGASGGNPAANRFAFVFRWSGRRASTTAAWKKERRKKRSESFVNMSATRASRILRAV